MTFVLLNWRWLAPSLGCLGLAIALLLARADARHWHKQADQIAALRKADQATWRAAAEKARADNIAHTYAVQLSDARIMQESERDLQSKLVDARALAARTVERLRYRPGTDQGAGGAAGGGAAADAPGDPFGPGRQAIVDAADVRICTENTVKAQGWQDWYRQLGPR